MAARRSVASRSSSPWRNTASRWRSMAHRRTAMTPKPSCRFCVNSVMAASRARRSATPAIGANDWREPVRQSASRSRPSHAAATDSSFPLASAGWLNARLPGSAATGGWTRSSSVRRSTSLLSLQSHSSRSSLAASSASSSRNAAPDVYKQTLTRGYTFAAVLADETAFWRDESSANPDVEIFRALRPGLATIPGAILLNASSPYRKTGVLYNAFARHFGKDDARVLVWRGTTLEMNAALDPAVVAEAYEDDAVSAAAEFGAEFRGDINDFVSREVVDACTVRGRVEMLYATGLNYVAFCDPSGGS